MIHIMSLIKKCSSSLIFIWHTCKNYLIKCLEYALYATNINNICVDWYARYRISFNRLNTSLNLRQRQEIQQKTNKRYFCPCNDHKLHQNVYLRVFFFFYSEILIKKIAELPNTVYSHRLGTTDLILYHYLLYDFVIIA